MKYTLLHKWIREQLRQRGKTIKYVVLRCLTKCSYSQINFGKTLTFRETYGICADMCSDIKSPFKQCAGSAEGDLIDLQCVLWGSGRRPTGNMGTALMLDWDQVALRTLWWMVISTVQLDTLTTRCLTLTINSGVKCSASRARGQEAGDADFCWAVWWKHNVHRLDIQTLKAKWELGLLSFWSRGVRHKARGPELAH